MGADLVIRSPKFLILGALLPIFVVLDQWTKILVLHRFALGESIAVIPGYFNLTYVRNTGAAFGLLAQAHPSFRVPFFLLVPVAALAAIGYIFWKIHPKDFKLATALSLVMSGALGNLIDRARLGYVVDFLDFHWQYQAHFPAFNVADSAISVGVCILMVDLFFKEEDQDVPSSV